MCVSFVLTYCICVLYVFLGNFRRLKVGVLSEIRKFKRNRAIISNTWHGQAELLPAIHL